MKISNLVVTLFSTIWWFRRDYWLYLVFGLATDIKNFALSSFSWSSWQFRFDYVAWVLIGIIWTILSLWYCFIEMGMYVYAYIYVCAYMYSCIYVTLNFLVFTALSKLRHILLLSCFTLYTALVHIITGPFIHVWTDCSIFLVHWFEVEFSLYSCLFDVVYVGLLWLPLCCIELC